MFGPCSSRVNDSGNPVAIVKKDFPHFQREKATILTPFDRSNISVGVFSLLSCIMPSSVSCILSSSPFSYHSIIPAVRAFRLVAACV
jgi:hypothetical protein